MSDLMVTVTEASIFKLEDEIERLTAELEHHKGKAEVWEDVARAALTPASDRHQLEPTDEYGVYSTDANKKKRIDPESFRYGYHAAFDEWARDTVHIKAMNEGLEDALQVHQWADENRVVDERECSFCKGSGEETTETPDFGHIQTECVVCNGTGTAVATKQEMK